jgi:F0F1-type ATP synthase assembly protein I
MNEEDNRSAVWGGATMGFFIGLIVGFFRDSYWQTVLYAVVIGACLGIAANLLSFIGKLFARQPPKSN